MGSIRQGSRRGYDKIGPPKSESWKKKYRGPGHFTDDRCFKLPSTWVWAAAEDVVEPGAEIVYGIVQPGPRMENGIPYVRGTDIQDGEILVDQLLKTSTEIAKKYERASLRGGDILLGIIRATKVAIVPPQLEGANITQGTARFRPSSCVSTKYLAYWLRSTFAQNWLHSHYRGIDMPGLNLRDVRHCPVPIAPENEQKEIVSRLQGVLTRIEKITLEHASSLRRIDQLDQSILAKAFCGELVPQDPDDEPASVLLERIRAEREAAEKTKPKRRGRKARAAV